MTISIKSRIRNALVGMSLLLCVGFSAVIFMIAFVIEDQVFVNQLKVQQNDLLIYLDHGGELTGWRASLPGLTLSESLTTFEGALSASEATVISANQGIHEYFNEQSAGFISHLVHPLSERPLFLQYDVSSLLVVRASKNSILILLGILSLLIAVLAIVLSRKLAAHTLTPIQLLTGALEEGQSWEKIRVIADNFSGDEVGVLARELAKSVEQEHDSAQREFEFNQGVSHELRSPIQVAKSAAELLEFRQQKDTHGDPRGSELPRLKRAVQQMEEVAEAFLWLSSDKLTSGERTSPEQIQSLCETAWPSVHIEFESQLASDQYYPIPFAPLMVIMRSLITNALEHGDKASIRVDCAEQHVIVSNDYSIEENGHPGFGIGESITSRLCERFGCRLVISNSNNGEDPASTGLTHSASERYNASLEFESLK